MSDGNYGRRNIEKVVLKLYRKWNTAWYCCCTRELDTALKCWFWRGCGTCGCGGSG